MKPSFKPLDQQVVVVTGASSGIGLATAVAAAEQGARVVLIARSTTTLETIAKNIRSRGGKAVAMPADVSQRDQLEEAAQRTLNQFGRIDTWVNNAGLSVYGQLDQVPDRDSRRLFDINFWGVVNGSLAALPHLRASGGALINVGSEASDAVIPLQGMYCASKHAVKGFTDALRLEQEADGAPVSITLIQPTAVDTPFPAHAANYLNQEPKLPTPMIEPEKVASAILDAATSAARDVRVGAMSVLNTTMARVMPALADVMAKKQIGRQQRNEAPHTQQGTLYKAGESGRVHGRGDDNAMDSKRAEAENIHAPA